MKKQKTSNAKLGGITLHILHDSDQIAAKARAGLDAKFIREACELFPDASDQTILKKSALIRRAHFVRMGMLSAKSRKLAASKKDGRLAK